MNEPMPDTVRAMLRHAKDLGWRVQSTRNGWRLLHPDGKRTANLHRSVSDLRAWRNLRAQLKEKS